jgi:methionyl-tRNA formyltransferase
MNKIRIVYMGTPAFAVEPLRSLINSGYDIAAVVTAPDRPSGRGLSMNSSDVKKFALENNLPVLQPLSLKDPAFLCELSSFGANLFIVVAFRMLPEVVWSMPKFGTFNLHASLLPNYRGAAPINWAIIKGEKITGVTTFLIDKQIDTGDILFQQTCPIAPEDDFGTLHDKLMHMGASLVVKSADAIAQGRCRPRLQSEVEAQMGDIPLAPKLSKETGRIEWKDKAENIRNLIRGLSPYPCAYSQITDSKVLYDVKIFRSGALFRRPEESPGSIVVEDKKRLLAACGDGYIEIEELQLAGKKRVKAQEFLSGFRNIEKFRFEL